MTMMDRIELNPRVCNLDQMLRLDVAQALRDEGHDVVHASESGKPDQMTRRYYKHQGVIRLKVNPTTSKNIIELLFPFLRNHSHRQFKDRLIILSKSRAKWVHTA